MNIYIFLKYVVRVICFGWKIVIYSVCYDVSLYMKFKYFKFYFGLRFIDEI